MVLLTPLRADTHASSSVCSESPGHWGHKLPSALPQHGHQQVCLDKVASLSLLLCILTTKRWEVIWKSLMFRKGSQRPTSSAVPRSYLTSKQSCAFMKKAPLCMQKGAGNTSLPGNCLDDAQAQNTWCIPSRGTPINHTPLQLKLFNSEVREAAQLFMSKG